MIAEFGWPSAGYNLKNAEPGPFEQAVVLRNFVTRAEAIGMEYNIVEAIDQPWKFFEGGVGPYWGILERRARAEIRLDRADRQRGLLEARGASRVLVGVLMSLPILRLAEPTVMQALRAVGGGQRRRRLGRHRVRLLDRALLRVRFGLRPDAGLDPAGAAGADRDGADRGDRRHRLRPRPAPADRQGRAAGAGDHRRRRQPSPRSRSISPPISSRPDMLKQTLDAVARLDYPNFECVVIINNTPDPEFWQPIQDHCRALGERFKFINAEKVEGFKAGALRIAMERTAADAEIIGIIDADYVVQPDWLKDLVPAFADPRVGLVQAPQDHRDGDRSLMHYIMNGEYAGFFDIGMVQRNEVNAIIVHGTMCLIRRAAMDMAGGWAGDTICEDTDLGLAIIEHGWLTHYTNHRYGHGLLPDTYEAFKKQRHRWAYGGFQIVKKHWRRFLPGASRLSPRPEARIRAGLAELARRRKPRRAGRDPQPDLGADRRLRRHRHSRQDPDAADHRRVRGVADALRGAVPAARAGEIGPDAGRHDRRDVGAVDGVARGRQRPDHRASAVRAHLQGRPVASCRSNSRRSGKR